MLTRTTELALRALIVLGLTRPAQPSSPRRLAASLGCSPTYLSKTLNLLVRAEVLDSVRGARGGVVLSRAPASITLLEVVEACQGTLVGAYCRTTEGDLSATCRYHRVMAAIHQETVRLLGACTLAELLASPFPERKLRARGSAACRMAIAGLERGPGGGRAAGA